MTPQLRFKSMSTKCQVNQYDQDQEYFKTHGRYPPPDYKHVPLDTGSEKENVLQAEVENLPIKAVDAKIGIGKDAVTESIVLSSEDHVTMTVKVPIRVIMQGWMELMNNNNLQGSTLGLPASHCTR